MEADEVVHLFIAPGPALLEATPAEALPRRSLKGFARVTVKPGQHQTVQLPLSSKDFQYAALGEAWLSPFCFSSCLVCAVKLVYLEVRLSHCSSTAASLLLLSLKRISTYSLCGNHAHY